MRSGGCTALARRTEYFFRETASGLRRNGLVAFAAVSTTFIALLLVGLALLVQREVNLIIDSTGGKVEVSIYLLDDVSESQNSAISEKLSGMPEVASVEYLSKEDACARFRELFADQPDLVDNLDCDALPASYRVKLKDPEQYGVIRAQLEGQPGIQKIVDQHDVLDKLFTVTGMFRQGVLFIGVFMLIMAGILIANTVRMGLYARRKEIGIMKLVGATNWFIRVPFLIEGVVEGLVGAVAAIATLFAFKALFINPLYGKITFLPWVQTADVVATIPWLIGAGVLVAVIASFVGMRRFLDI
jgi:cell division transport system permease protein